MNSPLADDILARLRQADYAVSVHQMQGGINLQTGGPATIVPERYIEMHAVCLAAPDQQFIARVEGNREQDRTFCALELARMVEASIA